MLFDKIGRKFYSPDDETAAELPNLNTTYAPPLWTAFPEFNDLILTPHLGMAMSGHSGGSGAEIDPGAMH